MSFAYLSCTSWFLVQQAVSKPQKQHKKTLESVQKCLQVRAEKHYFDYDNAYCFSYPHKWSEFIK